MGIPGLEMDVDRCVFFPLFHEIKMGNQGVPSGYVNITIWKIAIDIVDLPIEHGGSFHNFVS